MLYLFETELGNNKFVFHALLFIYGIDRYYSFFICYKLGFALNLKIKNLTKKQTTKLIKKLNHSI
jgi:ribosomal protein S13